MPSPPEAGPRALYQAILVAWNAQNAVTMAAHFTDDASLVGYDGSQVNTRRGIQSHLATIFGDHPTATYTALIQGVRVLSPQIALLRAVAGMIPPGADDFNPALNTVHSLVAAASGSAWLATLFHATPAAWHGRPRDVEALIQRLREVRRRGLTTA